jgi:hypothetical protein
MEMTPIEQLAAFVDTLKAKGVKSYRGEVPIERHDGHLPAAIDRFPIDIVFERPDRRGDE